MWSLITSVGRSVGLTLAAILLIAAFVFTFTKVMGKDERLEPSIATASFFDYTFGLAIMTGVISLFIGGIGLSWYVHIGVAVGFFVLLFLMRFAKLPNAAEKRKLRNSWKTSSETTTNIDAQPPAAQATAASTVEATSE
ncbi:hypothetical protein OAM67_00440 [bacterium]|nr:hypothetical protein [bacterium]